MTDLPRCTLLLNKKPSTYLVCDGQRYAAFTGDAGDVDDPAKQADAGHGPIPVGSYYIVDRPTGGHFPQFSAWLLDMWSHSDRSEWFALYANGTVSDFVFVQGVKRGNFRLHPIGRWGISEGCITLTNQIEFKKLAKYLRKQPVAYIPGKTIRYYGPVEVQ